MLLFSTLSYLIVCFKINYVLKVSIEFGRASFYLQCWFFIFRFFGKRTQWDCRGASNLEELHQLLSEIMIRRLKNDVLTQLPPKVRQRIPFDLPQAAAKVNFPLLLKTHLLVNSNIYVFICIYMYACVLYVVTKNVWTYSIASLLFFLKYNMKNMNIAISWPQVMTKFALILVWSSSFLSSFPLDFESYSYF